MPSTLFIAFGSSGDVIPLLAVATELCRVEGSGRRIGFMTHTQLMPRLQIEELPPELEIMLVHSSVLIAHCTREREDAVQRKAVLEHCQAFFGCNLSNFNRERAPTGHVIVYNLFALEGFCLAEAMHIPGVGASPCLPPRAAPPEFRAALELEQQALLAVLRSAPPGAVSWAHVREWLWPLFTDHWGPWREAALGLSALPYANCAGSLPPAPTLLLGVSPLLVSTQDLPGTGIVCGHWATRHADDHVPVARARGENPTAAVVREVLMDSPGVEPVLAGFGSSMGLLGYAAQETLLLLLCCLARRLARPMIVAGEAWDAGVLRHHAAFGTVTLCPARSRSPSPAPPAWGGELDWYDEHPHPEQPHKVYVMTTHCTYSIALPHCAVLIHAGGAGTLHAAVKSGVVQCVLPIHFDQPFWAAAVVSRGLGCAPAMRLHRILDDCDNDGPERWADRLAGMIQAQLRADGASEATRSAYATSLTAESGVEHAVAEIARVEREAALWQPK